MTDDAPAVGAIDCGTNSLRLLIAQVAPDGVVPIRRRTEIVRLGQGVDRTGRLADEAIERALRVLADYRAELDSAGAQAVAFAATSATRDAANADAFTEPATRVVGVAPRVLSGAEEASLSFVGAVVGLGLPAGDRVLVVDLGGGSTEFVRGTLAGGVETAVSLDIGSVRLFERHPGDELAAQTDIAAAVAQARTRVGFEQLTALVGVAGTVTTLTAFRLGLTEYDSAQVHGARCTAAESLDAAATMAAMSRSARARLPYLPPGRADVIGMGARIWAAVVAAVARPNPGLPVLTSETDILDGLANQAAEGLRTR